MATYTQNLIAAFGATYTGQASNIRVTVFDNTGTQQIAATNAPSGNAFAESTDAASTGNTGTYISRATIDTAWLPIHVKFTIVGQTGVAASTIIGSDRAAENADGYTIARGSSLDKLTALVPTSGVIAAGSSGTSINTTLTAPNINSYKGQVVVFSSGVLVGQTHLVASNTTGANSVLTVMTAPASNPSAADTFYLVTGIGQKASDFLSNAIGSDNKILLSANTQTGVTIPTVTTVGTLTTYTGNTPQTGDAYAQGVTNAGLIGALPSATTIAASVWNALTSGITTANSIGKRLLDFVTTLVYSAPSTPPTAVAIRQEIDSNSTQLATANAALTVANGLLGLNQGVRNFVYTGAVLNSYDLCTYDTAGHAATNDGVTGLVHKHSISLTYTSANQTGQTTQQIS